MLTHRSHRLVLVVDDDEGLRNSLKALLTSVGYLVSTAESSGQAVTEIGAQRPDLILTDIFMAEGDGYELINAIRNFREEIPVVAMSGGGFGTCDHLGVARRLGATAAIAKPFRSVELVETIDRVLGGRLAA